MSLLVFGASAGMRVVGLPRTSRPWLGVCERINIGGYLLWTAVFAVVLLSARDTAEPRRTPQP
ncbi:hypothetical protein AB0H12_38140 [Actinosynnema sp. NPDC023794]